MPERYLIKTLMPVRVKVNVTKVFALKNKDRFKYKSFQISATNSTLDANSYVIVFTIRIDLRNPVFSVKTYANLFKEPSL